MREQANSFSQPELSQEQGACLGTVLGQCARLGCLEASGEAGFPRRGVITAGILGKGRGASSLAGFFWPSPGCSLCCTIPIPGWVMQPRQTWQLLEERMTWSWSPPLLHPPESPTVHPGCVTSTGTALPALLALCLSEASLGAADNNW